MTSNQYDIEKPFLPDPGSCPNTMGDSGILRPGETAYIGLYMGFDFDDWGYEMFGDRGWEDIESLSFVVYLYTSEYPETSSSITESIDISFIIEDMPDRSRRPPTPGPILEPVPTATKSPGIGG
ncbi:MAG TPA: hypothetical protein G4O08_03095 [Anaerolineae bacterium]|nr:hypothetical protein [Anaerolineae bacterium]